MTMLQPVLRGRTRSLWLEEALAAEPAAEAVEPLTGQIRADVCIVGGGYTGLWTALRIKEVDPSVDVVIVEADICGAGASGRNGGMVGDWWMKLGHYIRLCGLEEALRLARASQAAIDAIGAFCERHGVDAHFVRKGTIAAATAPSHVGMLDHAVELCEAHGVDVFERLTPADVARRTGSRIHLGGVYERTSATVQPALLARGIRRVALERGIRIYEQSPVNYVDRKNPPVVNTDRGRVVADTVVLAINAWAAALPELRRAVLPMASDMIATEPMPERLAAIGWTGGESIADGNLMVDYYRTTRDGRIAFGKGGLTHAYLGRISIGFEAVDGRARRTEEAFHRAYPSLANVPITHRWTGPIDRTENNTLIFGTLDGVPAVHYGVGYSGSGVAQSWVGGHFLASRALGLKDEWTASPLNRGPWSLFPPDPIRYFGGIAVRAAVHQRELDLYAGRTPSVPVAALADLAPSGMKKE
jgi:glycine/D-amino acid oxidase-like deaminating enzyme